MSEAARGDAPFGAGGVQPYELALQSKASRLVLRGVDDNTEVVLDVARFLTAPSAAECKIVRSLPGPILDLGCGPGRMLQAAYSAGHPALGVDISAESIAIAHARGLQARHCSVFDELPDEGGWGAAMLVDGNVGIGGDPLRLLRRCANLIRPGGTLLIEAHPEPRRDRRFNAVLVGEDGQPSGPFPWAEVGARQLRSLGPNVGLTYLHTRRVGRRRFALLRS